MQSLDASRVNSTPCDPWLSLDIATLPMTTHVCGGFTEERPVDEEAAGVLEVCRAQIEEKVGAGYVADNVRTQVVAISRRPTS